MTQFSILVIENDPAVASALTMSLEACGYEVRTAACGADALDLAAAEPPDIVILELEQPDIDGIEICRRLRHWTRNPIIVLSADGEESRKISALDQGANDYVTKPFAMPELLARVRVAERHRQLVAMVVTEGLITVGDVVIDTGAQMVRVGGSSTDLARKEFALLTLLARNVGRVLTHGALLSQVWEGQAGSPQSLRSHVHQLRKKLGTGPDRPQVVSAHGTGYRLELPGVLDAG